MEEAGEGRKGTSGPIRVAGRVVCGILQIQGLKNKVFKAATLTWNYTTSLGVMCYVHEYKKSKQLQLICK